MKRSFLVGNYVFGGSFLDSACKIGYTIYRKGAVRNGQLPPANKSIRMTAHVWRLRAVIFYCSIATDEKQPSLAESLYDRGSHVRMAPFYFASPSCAPVADMIK